MPLNKDYMLIETDGKYKVIPRPESGIEAEPFILNEPAAYIYMRLEEGLNAKKIASKMCLVYMADPVELETDILELLVLLKRRGMYYD